METIPLDDHIHPQTVAFDQMNHVIPCDVCLPFRFGKKSSRFALPSVCSVRRSVEKVDRTGTGGDVREVVCSEHGTRRTMNSSNFSEFVSSVFHLQHRSTTSRPSARQGFPPTIESGGEQTNRILNEAASKVRRDLAPFVTAGSVNFASSPQGLLTEYLTPGPSHKYLPRRDRAGLHMEGSDRILWRGLGSEIP